MAEGHSYESMQREYMKVFGALMGLSVLTVLAAMLPLHGPIGITLGLLIAAVKTLMVMYIFMHLKFDHPYLRIMVIVPLFLLCIMIFAFKVLGI